MLISIQEPTENLESQHVQAIGIDLGTTHSLVAVAQEGVARVLTFEGSPLIPSLFGFKEGEWVVGRQAYALRQTHPHEVLSSIKRLMGRGREDPIALAFPHLLETTSERGLVVQLAERQWTPMEISAALLRHLYERVQEQLGYAVTQAVITVPAYFDEAARQATRDAAHLAGFQVLRLISEPTAAALAYGLDQGVEGLWGVFDLGGGTFDFSLLRMEKGVFQVKATGGDLNLGGDDFDGMLACARWGEAWEAFSDTEKAHALVEACALKEDLTQHESTQSWDGQWTVSREEFEKRITPLVDRMCTCVQQVLRDGSVQIADLQGILLVGGATRVPFVRQTLASLLGREPLSSLDPDQAVVLGAALQAEALTYGAQHLLLDVTPLSLGIEVMGEQVEHFIHRNTRIPVAVTQTFTTHEGGQTALLLHVLQGESTQVRECRSLARFELRGIPPLPAGQARIDVTFSLDTDGLLTVKAQEKTTEIHQEIQVKPTYGLTPEVMREMILEQGA